jgi:SAM-dependent methyltransferase
MDSQTIKSAVRERYAGFVTRNQSCCGTTLLQGAPAARTLLESRAEAGQGQSSAPACGCDHPGDLSLQLGYENRDLQAVPEGANLGLGCGNPVAMASLKPGETVLDLGSGAGFDAFLAAQRVGPGGQVIGVDMTPQMIERATSLAKTHGYANVEFRLGDIEQLPVADGSVDAIISNCVVNLTTDKPRVFREAYRVMKPGGRLMVSDLVLVRPLPQAVREDLDAYGACIAGALLKDDYLAAIEAAGFAHVRVAGERRYALDMFSPELLETARKRYPGLSEEELEASAGAVLSIQVEATKASRACGCAPTCCPR